MVFWHFSNEVLFLCLKEGRMKLRNIFKSRDKPRNSTPGQSFIFRYGGSTAGKNVSETSAMQITAVYACVRILSEAVA